MYVCRPSCGLAMRCVDGGAAIPGLAEASCAPHLAVGLVAPGFDHPLGMVAVTLSLGYKLSRVR
jgi:hypothetical protein